MRKTILTLALTVFYITVNAQTNWLWSGGGAGNDEALKNATDNAGNIYTTGYFSLNATFDTYLLTATGGSGDIFVTKQNAAGSYLWAVKAGGVLSDRAYGITTDNAGNIIITGFFTGQANFGTITLQSANSSQDIFVAKLDPAGNFIWAKHFGGSDIDLAFSVQVDAVGNSIITGQFRDTVQFGSSTFISRVNPTSGLPTFDAFILKLDANGNVVWAKQGAASYDDRGIAVACSNDYSIYVTGQFSDTLTFDNAYNNNAYNACFILKLDSAGNEIWFRKLFAAQVMAYDIKCFNQDIYVAGDYQGNLSMSPGTLSIANSYPYKIFVLKLDSSGSVVASHADGSDHFTTAQSLAVDALGNAYCVGLFTCVFSSYAQTIGMGVFNSAGYRDVFLSKYDAGLQRLWSRQFAGPHDDFCSSLSLSSNGSPIIAGSFERNFNIPRVNSFAYNTCNHDSSAWGPAQVAGFCTDADYGQYISVSSKGNKDVFSAQPYNPARLTYDFFDRPASSCQLDTLMPGLNNFNDSIIGCDSVKLFLTTRTGNDGVIGPEYDYQWSNGSLNAFTYVYTSGWHVLHFSYKDQCRVFTDSVYVSIYTTPPVPIISSSVSSVQFAIPSLPCPYKLLVVRPNTATLTGSNIPPGYTGFWQTPTGTVAGITCTGLTSGNYEFIVTAPGGGCMSSQCVELFYYDTLGGQGQCLPGNFKPEIHFINTAFDATDTVTICKNDFFDFVLVDSTYYTQGILNQLPTFVAWSKTGGFVFKYPLSADTTFNDHLQSVKAITSGNCTVTAQVLDPFSLNVMTVVTRSFYLNVLPTPVSNVVFNGSTLLCPGDTILLTLSGGANYHCSGPGMIASSTANDSIWVNLQGAYTALYSVTDTVSGCSDSGQVVFNLAAIPEPLITMFPASGIICPGDSVKLTAQPGTSFTWYGPLGNIISTSQTVYVTVPGFYHYTLTDLTGCTLLSEFKEVKAYTTPYLFADPGPVLCNGGSITLSVFTNDSSSVNWLPPLSGNSLSQFVDSVGMYSCSVSACGVTTTISINIAVSGLSAQIIPQGPLVICQNTTLTLQANNGMASYTWMPGYIASPFYNVSTAGQYSVTITDSYGCTATDSIVVDTFPLPTAPLVSTQTICAGNTVTLQANASLPVYWYATSSLQQVIDSGNVFITPTLFTDTTFYAATSDSICLSLAVPVQVIMNPVSLPPVLASTTVLCRLDTLSLFISVFPGALYSWTGPANFTSSQPSFFIAGFDTVNTGYYHLQVSDAQCTGPVDSVLVTLFPFHASNVYSNSPLCEGDTLFLQVDSIAGASYLWYGPSGFMSTMQNPIIVNASQQNNEGAYSVVITEGQCVNNPINAIVTINSIPASPLITGNTSYCSGDTVHLQTTPLVGAIYQWYFADSTLLTGNSVNIIADTSLHGIFTVTVIDNGCSNKSSASLAVVPEPSHAIVSNSPICENDSLVLMVGSNSGALYEWTGPGQFMSLDSSVIIANVVAQQSGYYTLQVRANGCKSKKDSVYVSVYAYPDFDLMSDTTICEGSSFIANAPADLGTYNWNNVAFNNTFTVTDTGLVTLTVSAHGLCKTTHSFYVHEINCDVFIPNVFTPQGDGINDEYEFVYNNAREVSLEIFNRWGNRIKELKGSIVKWDGTNEQGKQVSAGSYYYTAHVIDYFGTIKKFKGNIELIK